MATIQLENGRFPQKFMRRLNRRNRRLLFGSQHYQLKKKSNEYILFLHWIFKVFKNTCIRIIDLRLLGSVGWLFHSVRSWVENSLKAFSISIDCYLAANSNEFYCDKLISDELPFDVFACKVLVLVEFCHHHHQQHIHNYHQ